MKPIDLHTLRREDFYRRAVDRMAELCPGWSDDFPSDPAAAVLELACYLSDLQGGHINAIGSAHYAAFLNLLGERAAERAPAVLTAKPLGPRPWPGQRFWIDGVPYEAVEGTAETAELRRVLLERGGRLTPWDMELPLVMEDGDGLYLELSEPLAGGAQIWCEVRPEEGRVPPEETTPPPVRLRAGVPDQNGGWAEVPVEDGTCGLLQSGCWTLTAGTGALRLTWDGPFEGRPEISSITLGRVRLEQRHTRSAMRDLRPPFPVPEGWAGNRVLRCFLPVGEGWRAAPELFVRDGLLTGWTGAAPEVIRVAAAEPDFRAVFPLRPLAGEQVDPEEPGVLRDSLRLMAEEDGLWYDCPVRETDPARTLDRGCRWDRERDLLRFGDGRDFRVPKEGRLLVCACALTRGTAGNGAFGTFGQGEIRLAALRPASGGADRESAKDAFFRAVREFSTPLRAVTCEDYEALARTTPGLALRQVRAAARRRRGEAGVTVLAKPSSREALPALTAWQADRLRERLEECRLIGVPVRIQSPRYLPIGVTASLRADAPVDEGAVRRAAEQVVDGVTGPVEFGAELSCPALFAALAKVEGVLAVTALEPALERRARELILYGVRGRFLCFTVCPAQELTGYALSFPGRSIDEGLPGVMRDDETLRRFLGVYQSAYMDINRANARFPGRLDPRAEDALPGLKYWLGAARWMRDEPQLPSLLSAAPMLNRLRGTRRGLDLLLQVVTGGRGELVEHFQWQSRAAEMSAREREDCARLYGTDRNGAILLLPEDTPPAALGFLEDVLEDFIPLGVSCSILTLRAGALMDGHSYLDGNAELSEPPPPEMDETSLDDFSLE